MQLMPGEYRSLKPIIIIAIEKVHLKCDCISGSIVNGIREPMLFSFDFDNSPGHKIYKESKVNFFKKFNKSVLTHITDYLEDDDHKRVDFNGQII